MFYHIIIVSLACVGLRVSMGHGMLLHFLQQVYDRASTRIKFVLKPVIGCVTCMASVWGLLGVGVWASFDTNLKLTMIIACTPFFLFAVAGLNTLLWYFYEYTKAVYEHSSAQMKMLAPMLAMHELNQTSSQKNKQ